ncbi:hypothetical protein KC19_VG254600 [Ceratodon purpureus]|uniref:Uncharacterized protein n=1 Tax=Ceratodon purpureus TaxID=3225 RepID=A0A8T0HUA9_CERPU|nr:hypothetical protein KC19_VG254600 [Ceratodon purpureus]
MGMTKIVRPCRIHMREAQHTIASYKQCVKANTQHPWFYGATEGFDVDDLEDK